MADENETPSIRDTMEAAFDKIEDGDQEPPESEQEDSVEEPEAPTENDGEAAEEATETTETASQEEAEDTDETTSDHREDVEVEPDEQPGLDFPASWSPALKDDWSGIPPAIQQEVLKREADFQKGLQQNAERSKELTQFESILEPVRQTLELSGTPPTQYVQRLVAADRWLRENPAEAIKWLVDESGVSWDQLSPSADDPLADPQVTALKNEINGLKSTVEKFQANTQQQQVNDTQAAIDAFAKDHEHFEEVRSYMGAFIQSGQAQDLQAAYDMAIWAHPTIRETLRTSEKQAAEEQRKKDQAEKVAKAKKASAANVKSKSVGGGSTPKNETMRQTMERTFDAIQG